MKKKELKNLAEKIAEAQVIMDTTEDNEEKRWAQREIIELSSKIEDFEDYLILDEMIQKNIQKKLDRIKKI